MCDTIGCDIATLVVRVSATIGAAVAITHAIAFDQALGRRGWHCDYRLREKRDERKEEILHDCYLKVLD